jgi:hypothetical protein
VAPTFDSTAPTAVSAGHRPALVLDSQRSVSRASPLVGYGCPRPRRRWDADLFQFLSVSCKRWDCEVCGPRKSRELARVLVTDALTDPPQYALTLTTRDPDTSADLYRRASAAVWKRLRRHGRVEYFGFIEFTTGTGTHSGGRRRMHGHYRVKFRDTAPEEAEATRLVCETWESVTGAFRVAVERFRTPAGAMAYLSLHHQKPQQAPPREWRGMRSRPSQGYFLVPLWNSDKPRESSSR